MNRYCADHIAFRVSDMDRAIEFYCNKLGLLMEYDTVDRNHHERFVFLKLEGASIELLQMLDDKNNPVPFDTSSVAAPYCPHFAIRTDNLETTTQQLQEAGITIIKGPLEIPGQVKWLYIADPDQNIIEFVEWIKDTNS